MNSVRTKPVDRSGHAERVPSDLGASRGRAFPSGWRVRGVFLAVNHREKLYHLSLGAAHIVVFALGGNVPFLGGGHFDLPAFGQNYDRGTAL
jgi:hypothetical protein